MNLSRTLRARSAPESYSPEPYIKIFAAKREGEVLKIDPKGKNRCR